MEDKTHTQTTCRMSFEVQESFEYVDLRYNGALPRRDTLAGAKPSDRLVAAKNRARYLPTPQADHSTTVPYFSKQ
ncbi:hypothetical protein EVAR_14494_1 [Eumeta japonica]|uniref:Uncharacterized protein n=1 Tax=Eumeta variegata TaxID=151549 RepID=A0A4C1U3D1_EUMVA|nr:hypothetical protein EVAR_14494_1 [Eumeta japonica]